MTTDIIAVGLKSAVRTWTYRAAHSISRMTCTAVTTFYLFTTSTRQQQQTGLGDLVHTEYGGYSEITLEETFLFCRVVTTMFRHTRNCSDRVNTAEKASHKAAFKYVAA